MNNIIVNLLCNPNFWSALFGLLGTILIFFFGLPPRVDQEGQCYLVTGEIDEEEKKKSEKYKWTSYLGLFFVSFSFLIQMINIVITTK